MDATLSPSSSDHTERALRALMDAAVPALLEMIREYAREGGDVAEVAGCVVQPEPRTSLAEATSAEVLLVPRERAMMVARGAAPEHAHLLEGRAASGHFHVVAVADGRGAVIALSLPDAPPPS